MRHRTHEEAEMTFTPPDTIWFLPSTVMWLRLFKPVVPQLRLATFTTGDLASRLGAVPATYGVNLLSDDGRMQARLL